MPAHEGAHGIQAAIEKQRADDRFHGVRKHGALAAKAAAVLALAEAQVAAQVEIGGDLGHVLPADQLRAHPGQLAFAPLRMEEKHGLGHHQAQHGVAKEFEPFVVGGGVIFLAALEIRSFASDRWVSARTSRSGFANVCPSADSSSLRTGDNCAPEVERAVTNRVPEQIVGGPVMALPGLKSFIRSR